MVEILGARNQALSSGAKKRCKSSASASTLRGSPGRPPRSGAASPSIRGGSRGAASPSSWKSRAMTTIHGLQGEVDAVTEKYQRQLNYTNMLQTRLESVGRKADEVLQART